MLLRKNYSEYDLKLTDHSDSFEMGRVYSGLRFVYPIYDENKKHLGSVEISFDISVFSIDFMKTLTL